MADLVVSEIRSWAILSRAALRSEFQHKANVVLGIFGGIALQGVGLGFIGTMLSRFGDIGGWTLPELTLLYGMRLCAHGLCTVIFAPLLTVDYALREGEFDGYLTRPVGVLIQLATRRFMVSTISDLLGGITVLTVGVWTAGITSIALLYVVLAVVGGALIELSVQLATSSLVFRVRSTGILKIVLDNILNSFGNYPMKIFPTTVRWGLITVFPIAFSAHFPAALVLGRGGELWISSGIAWLSPGFGLIMALGSYALWRRQLRSYSSNGT